MNIRKIMLPDQQLTKKEYDFEENQSLVVIGANGSGKSRLGAWIELNNSIFVHRISAQRSLIVPDFIQLKSYQQAFDELFWGDAKNKQNNKAQRWNYGKFTTSLLNDYDKMLSTLFAKQNKINNDFAMECKRKDIDGQPYNKVPETEVDKIINIWKEVFPHRELVLEDASVNAKLSDVDYPGREMSDGERVALYLMGQCMCAPENSIIVIDEPEVHLHNVKSHI